MEPVMKIDIGSSAMLRDSEYAYGFLEKFQDRIFFGMDLCCLQNVNQILSKLPAYLDDAMLSGAMSNEAYVKISRGNVLYLPEA